MKVKCLKRTDWVSVGETNSGRDPQYGEVCEVVRSIRKDGKVLYKLAGYENIYDANSFRITEVDDRLTWHREQSLTRM